ncbi:hypothetical protein XM25_07920 [Devosia sp. H5989]|nr:hypothetical protein XM25_07920 [Devosia sp. H5989]
MTEEALIARLRGEIADKDERIRQLMVELGAGWSAPTVLGLTYTEAAILGLLMRRDLVSRDMAMTVLYGDRSDPPDANIVSVYIVKLRRKLSPRGINIVTSWAQGWSLTPESKALVASMRDQERRS